MEGNHHMENKIQKVEQTPNPNTYQNEDSSKWVWIDNMDNTGCHQDRDVYISLWFLGNNGIVPPESAATTSYNISQDSPDPSKIRLTYDLSGLLVATGTTGLSTSKDCETEQPHAALIVLLWLACQAVLLALLIILVFYFVLWWFRLIIFYSASDTLMFGHWYTLLPWARFQPACLIKISANLLSVFFCMSVITNNYKHK